MPTTINEALRVANLKPDGVVKWGNTIPISKSGVYIVSLTDDIDSFNGTLHSAPLSKTVFDKWLSVCPNLTLDDHKPDPDKLMERIQSFWLPDEVILYIGKATSLSSRVNQYYVNGLRTTY